MKYILTESQLKFIVEDQKTLDIILDKISSDGVESLNFREREFLKDYSKGKTPDYIKGDINDKKGEKIVSSLRNDMEFVFSETIETDETIEYYGSFYFKGEEYVGAFVCDKENNLLSVEFWIWGTSDTEQINLFDSAEGMEREIELFFEDDVLPKLIE